MHNCTTRNDNKRRVGEKLSDMNLQWSLLFFLSQFGQVCGAPNSSPLWKKGNGRKWGRKDILQRSAKRKKSEAIAKKRMRNSNKVKIRTVSVDSTKTTIWLSNRKHKVEILSKEPNFKGYGLTNNNVAKILVKTSSWKSHEIHTKLAKQFKVLKRKLHRNPAQLIQLQAWSIPFHLKNAVLKRSCRSEGGQHWKWKTGLQILLSFRRWLLPLRRNSSFIRHQTELNKTWTTAKQKRKPIISDMKDLMSWISSNLARTGEKEL